MRNNTIARLPTSKLRTSQPGYILDLLLSIINVSMLTVDIVEALPEVRFE